MAHVVFNYPTHIRFGDGVRAQLPAVLAEAGVERPLVVTDRMISELPWFPAILESLEGFEVAVFDAMGGNPVVAHVDAGTRAAQAHRADAIIALGGGAPVDVAKVVALMQHHPGHLFDYEDGKPDGRPVDQPMPFIVALPTTAGTGSEVGRSSVVSDDATKAKKIIFSPRLLPAVVLADPELTLGLPAGVTAATGMDALTHLIEAFLAKGHHAMADGIALEGIRLVAGALETAVRAAGGGDVDPGEHRQARADMLEAAMMGATAFQKGLGVNHSCAHALSTICDTHHGLANAVMLPTCMRFNWSAAPERFLRMAQVIEPMANDGVFFIDWIEHLCGAIGIPPDLDALGVPRDRLDDLVAVALADACHPSNPRPVSAFDFRALFSEAFGR